MRSIQKQKVQMINVNVDTNEKLNGEIQNRVIFTKSDDTSFTIQLNDEEVTTPEITPVAISEKLKVLKEDYLTIEELDSFNELSWETTSEERDYIPFRPKDIE
jgi:hypothetical protein